MNKMRMIAGLDIGNGYVKGKVKVDDHEPMLIDMPSIVAYTVGVDVPKQASNEYMSAFENELDATVVSRAIKGIDAGRVFFGQRAIRSGENQREFNITDHTPKCQDALSTMLIMGSIASAALRTYWNDHHELPSEMLNVDVCVGIALPIEDYMDWKDTYTNTLKNDNHRVTIHNFDRNVDIMVHFVEVTPIAEGAAAQYAITSLGTDFLQFALDDARESGANIDAGYTGEVLAQVENTIGIDIGEGTTNFPVFVGGDVSIESSKSINKGYGTVLTNVVVDTRNTKGLSFASRKDLADFMLDASPVPAKVYRRERLQHVIDAQVINFARDVMSEFTSIFRKVGARTDAIYVYGGGANDVKKTLYPMLVDAASDDMGSSIPVIYLDSQYSRDLNRTGLYEVAMCTATIVWGEDAE